MNNAFSVGVFGLEFPQETANTDQLKEREAKLVRMIEALAALGTSREWSTLKSELFDGALETIENRIKSEAGKTELNDPELYRLQGERKWARRYADLAALADTFRAELAQIRKIKPPEPSG